jgi:hypothetical protein
MTRELVGQAGPNLIFNDRFVTLFSDQCGEGTFDLVVRDVQFANGVMQGHGRGTFEGSLVDATGQPREGTISYNVVLRNTLATDGTMTVRLTFLSGTGTDGLAGLHGGGVGNWNFGNIREQPMLFTLHWDP